MLFDTDPPPKRACHFPYVEKKMKIYISIWKQVQSLNARVPLHSRK